MRRLASVLLASVLLVPLGARGDDAAEKAAKEARTSFLRSMKETDPAVRAAAVKRLAELGTVEAAKLLVSEVLAKETSGRVIDTAIGALSRGASPEAVAWLAGASRSGSWRERAGILEALARRIDPSPAWDAFRTAAEDKDPRVRTMGLFGLGACRRPEAVPLLLAELEAEEWQVRVAAIEGLGALEDERAVKPLILRLREETGRLRGDIADALEALTGKKFGIDVDLWISWLQAKEAGEPEPPAAKPEEAGPASSTTETPTYYGVRVLSEKVVFVIDLSLSMKDPIEIDRRKLMRETRARTPGGEGDAEPRKGEGFEDTIKWWEIQCRLDLAKAMLVWAIGQLDRRQSFDIVMFSDEAEAWQGRLVAATPMARARAAAWVESLDAIGRTNTWAALALAFDLAGKGRGETGRYATGADTIFFLTDGAPSVGEFVEPGDILTEVRRLNQTRRIKIHVIDITNGSVPFLRALAEETGGEYKKF